MAQAVESGSTGTGAPASVQAGQNKQDSSAATTAAGQPETPEALHRRVESIVRRNVYWALGVGIVPFPLVDFVGITAVELKMVKELADAYQVKFSENTAKSIITSLAGTVHELWTGVCLWLRPADWQLTWQERSLVRMKSLSDSEIDAYLKTRKWVGCSGAYAIEMPNDPLLTVVEGTASNVIGLPMESLARALAWAEGM